MGNNFCIEAIEQVIKNNNEKELIETIIGLGRDCETQCEVEYALNHLVNLSKHNSSKVRASVIMALEMMIVFGFKIDRDILEPMIIEVYNKSEIKDLSNVEDCIKSIKFHTKWDIKLYKTYTVLNINDINVIEVKNNYKKIFSIISKEETIGSEIIGNLIFNAKELKINSLEDFKQEGKMTLCKCIVSDCLTESQYIVDIPEIEERNVVLNVNKENNKLDINVLDEIYVCGELIIEENKKK